MKLIIEKETNKIVFAGNDLMLTAEGVIGPDFRASRVRPDKHFLMTHRGSFPKYFTPARYKYVDGDFVMTAEGEAEIKEIRKQELAAKRFEYETSGISVNGINIITVRESQATINSTFNAAKEDPNLIIDWKGTNGWFKLTSPMIIQIGYAVKNFVQACFTREMQLSKAIDEDVNADINVGWPPKEFTIEV